MAKAKSLFPPQKEILINDINKTTKRTEPTLKKFNGSKARKKFTMYGKLKIEFSSHERVAREPVKRLIRVATPTRSFMKRRKIKKNLKD